MKNDYEVRGDITVIFLHRKGKRLECIIDTEDLPKVDAFPNTWFPFYSKDIDDYYAVGRMIVNGVAQHLRIHRLVMDTPRDMVVDHLNHKTLDNRKNNLRNVTDNQNKQNIQRKKGSRGVKWDDRINKWTVTVNVNKEALNFGYFENYDEAIEISKRARAKYLPFSLEAKEGYRTDGVIPLKKQKAKNLSGVKGITWHEFKNRWRVRTVINGKMRVVGSYENLADAIQKLTEYKVNQPS